MNRIRTIAAGLALAIGVTAAAPSLAAAPQAGRNATVEAKQTGVETVDYRKHRRDKRHGWNKHRRHHWQPHYGYYKPWKPYYGYYGYYVPRPYWGYGY